MKSVSRLASPSRRYLHPSQARRLNPIPIIQAGHLPTIPLSAVSRNGERVDRRWRQVEPFKRGRELHTTESQSASAVGERPWTDVTVEPNQDGLIVYLDGKPVRTSQSKVPLPIPFSKPLLATAVAVEWDFLTSAQQALQPHNIPATSIASRAHDLTVEDAATASSGPIRDNIIKTVLPYLDTDTLLCWAPPPGKDADSISPVEPSLRDRQISTAQPIISYLTSSVWPGVHLQPGLENGSIRPSQQPQKTQDIVRGWLAGLKAWELVGLERAVLAGKSLLVGARLLCEWGESFADVRKAQSQRGKRFGIKEAAEACSLEVAWQTGRWGEVEDTHDVDKEDLRRQFGNAILVMGGASLPPPPPPS